MIKCIAIDMDGTLVSSKQVITKENEEAIKRAQTKGVEVVIATGRSYEEAIEVLKEAKIETPLICINGAEIRSLSHEIVDTNPLDKQTAVLVQEILNNKGIYFEVYTNKGTYTRNKAVAKTLILDIFTVNGAFFDKSAVEDEIDERLAIMHEVNSFAELFTNEEVVIYKMLAFSKDKQQLQEAKEKLSTVVGLAVSSSAQDNLELTALQAQKGVALQSFVESRGISLEHTMAIGDNFNDLSMLQMAGTAVAMGNASLEIQKQCDFVTTTNDESGVGKAIKRALNV